MCISSAQPCVDNNKEKTMLNKEGHEMNSKVNEEEELYHCERAPPFNPDFLPPAPTSSHQQVQAHSPDRPPPYYDPILDESVVWDENLSHGREHSCRNEGGDEVSDPPVTPSDENGEYTPSLSSSNQSPAAYWSKTKHLAQGTWNKMKRFEEKHEISQKTRKGAKLVYKQTKKATLTASRKVKEFDDKHQVVAKSKNGIVQGSTYISSKCRRRQTM